MFRRNKTNCSKIILWLLVIGGFFIWPNFCFGAINDVVINEIMYDLPGTDSKHEWIEILNTSDTEIDLTDWKFNDGSNHILNEPPKNGGQGSLKISAGEYLILTGDATIFLTDHPGFSGTVIDTVMSLKNTSATLKILHSEGNEINSVTYESTWGADGNGKTLEKINPQGTNTQNNWQESVSDGGTPGILNSSGAEIPPGEEPPTEEPSVEGWIPATVANRPPIANAGPDITALVNQEISFDAFLSYDPDNDTLTYFWNFGDGATETEEKASHIYPYSGQYIVTLLVDDGELSDLDIITVNIYNQSVIISEFIPNPTGSDTENEWIELFNQSGQIANLTNWQLDDQEDGSSPFVFPANSLIAPKQFLVIRRPISKISLNNDQDQVRLIYPDGSLATEVSYAGESKQGFSVAFDGLDYFWTKIPTPGSANIISPVGLEGQEQNISSNNPQPVIEQTQEAPEILAEVNLNQGQEFSALNPSQDSEVRDFTSEDSQSSQAIDEIEAIAEGLIESQPQQAASLAQTSQSSQKASLILTLSIIISGSLLVSWFLIRLKKRGIK